MYTYKQLLQSRHAFTRKKSDSIYLLKDLFFLWISRLYISSLIFALLTKKFMTSSTRHFEDRRFIQVELGIGKKTREIFLVVSHVLKFNLFFIAIRINGKQRKSCMLFILPAIIIAIHYC